MTVRNDWVDVLAIILKEIEANDANYPKRYGLVLEAMEVAHNKLNYPAGIRIDPTEPEWPVVYIELPTGQVSWHMPQHPMVYDGHSTDEKYARINEFGKGRTS